MSTNKIREKLENDFFFGTNFGFLAKSGAFSTEQAMKDVEAIAQLNTPWVCVMVNVVQERFFDTHVYGDFDYTPSDFEIERIIRAFRQRGIKVMLKLINITLDSQAHCAIMFNQPPVPPVPENGKYYSDMEEWFKEFSGAVVHYAELMERVEGELLCMSGELIPTQRCGKEWRDIIRQVRQVYRGGVTYECSIFEERGVVVEDWYELFDVLAISKYPSASDKPDPSVEYMIDYIRKNSLPAIKKIHERMGRPLFFAECGCRSVSIGHSAAWGWTAELPYNPQAQADYLEALMTVFSAEPWWRGLLWWKWDEQQNRPQYHIDQAGDTGFEMRDKPEICEAVSKWSAIIKSRQVR